MLFYKNAVKIELLSAWPASGVGRATVTGDGGLEGLDRLRMAYISGWHSMTSKAPHYKSDDLDNNDGQKKNLLKIEQVYKS